MKTKMFITAALAAATLAQPASAYTFTTTGQTLADKQLAVDVLKTIALYSKSTGGCSFIASAHMRVMPRGYRSPVTTIRPEARGGHFERWTVNVCAAKQVFQVALWPSPRGGTDFAVTPVTGRLPLHTRIS